MQRNRDFWNERYRTGQTGWDRPEHSPHLESALVRLGISSGRVLDIGCGRGRNSRFLAECGFSVVGVDISELAIEDARSQHCELPIAFYALDLLAEPIPGGPFELVYDFGCWHSFDDPADRARLAKVVADVLAPGGHWTAMIGSTDGHERQVGPPRRSAADITSVIEPHFEILSLVRAELHPNEDPVRPVWLGDFRKR